MKTETTKTTARTYTTAGVPNVMRLVTHEGDESGPLFLRVKRDGKAIWRALQTTDLKLATKRAAALIAEIDAARAAGQFKELPKMREAFAPVAKVCAAYLKAATIKSAPQNVHNLKFVLRRAGKDPEGSTEQLGAEVVFAFNLATVKAAGTDRRRQLSAKRSANSAIRSARALFKPEMLTAYKMAKLTLPLERIREFLEAPGEKVPQVQYVEPPAAVINKIGANYPTLRETDPAAYAWFLLGAFLGLRDGEVRGARWDWVEVDGEGEKFWLRIPSEMTKTVHGRSVEIPPAVLAELHALRGCQIGGADADAQFIVPAATMTERTESALKRVNRFLRACGLTQDLFPKAFYELRKYYGNDRVWRSKDIYTTARALGHSPEMLEKYYSSSSGRAPIVIPAPVVSEAAIQKATAEVAALAHKAA